jgi:hypothetical protein
MKQLVFTVPMAVLACLLTWHVRGCMMPDPSGPAGVADTLQAGRPLAPADTANPSRPETIVQYREVEKLVPYCADVPEELDSLTLTVNPVNPIRITPGRAVHTYFVPRTGAYEQAIYRVPERRWGYNVSAGVLYEPDRTGSRVGLSGAATLRYKTVSLLAGVRAYPEGIVPYGALHVRLAGRP